MIFVTNLVDLAAFCDLPRIVFSPYRINPSKSGLILLLLEVRYPLLAILQYHPLCFVISGFLAKLSQFGGREVIEELIERRRGRRRR
jgi:hypothetical protein